MNNDDKIVAVESVIRHGYTFAGVGYGGKSVMAHSSTYSGYVLRYASGVREFRLDPPGDVS